MLPKCPTCYQAPKVPGNLTIDKLPKQLRPNCGDISVCFKCGSINEFNDVLDLIKVNESTLTKMMLSDPLHYFTLNKISEEVKKMRKI
jgi:hypothetical protein